MAVFGKRSKTNLDGIHPNLVKLMNEAIKTTPVDFTIIQGVRTAKQQNELYNKGRRGIQGERKVTNVDGYNKKSNHQPKADGFGYAVDLYPFKDGKLLVDDKSLNQYLPIIARHIKEVAKNLNIKITWGGDWKMYDTPHFELS